MIDLNNFDVVVERSLVRVLIVDASLGLSLLLKRGGNEKFGVGLWEILQGSRDQGEGPDEACLREIKEEIGVDVTALIKDDKAVLVPVSSDKFAIAHPKGHAEDWSNFNYILIGHNLRGDLGALTLDADHDALHWADHVTASKMLGDDPYSLGGQRLLAALPAMANVFATLAGHLNHFFGMQTTRPTDSL